MTLYHTFFINSNNNKLMGYSPPIPVDVLSHAAFLFFAQTCSYCSPFSGCCFLCFLQWSQWILCQLL